MANLDRIVKMQISLRTSAVQQLLFSGLMLVGETLMPDRVRRVSSADELLTDVSFGLLSSSPLYRAAQVAFSQTPSPADIYIGRMGSEEDVATAMAAIAADDNSFYGFVDTSRATAKAIEFAEWAEANQKLHVLALQPSDMADVGNLMEGLQDGNFFRTAWWYTTDKTAAWPDVAITAKKFQTLPGGETWANSTLSAVPSTNISETLYNLVRDHNGNTFEPFRNLSITQIGKTAGGEWIDVIRFRDWLQEEARTSIFNRLVNNRIPYTDPGIEIVGQALGAALDLGVRRQGISPPELNAEGTAMMPSYIIRLPRSAQVSFSDKAARLLRDVSFTARLAGAIHAVEVTGTLTYENI